MKVYFWSYKFWVVLDFVLVLPVNGVEASVYFFVAVSVRLVSFGHNISKSNRLATAEGNLLNVFLLSWMRVIIFCCCECFPASVGESLFE